MDAVVDAAFLGSASATNEHSSDQICRALLALCKKENGIWDQEKVKGLAAALFDKIENTDVADKKYYLDIAMGLFTFLNKGGDEQFYKTGLLSTLIDCMLKHLDVLFSDCWNKNGKEADAIKADAIKKYEEIVSRLIIGDQTICQKCFTQFANGLIQKAAYPQTDNPLKQILISLVPSITKTNFSRDVVTSSELDHSLLIRLFEDAINTAGLRSVTYSNESEFEKKNIISQTNIDKIHDLVWGYCSLGGMIQSDLFEEMMRKLKRYELCLLIDNMGNFPIGQFQSALVATYRDANTWQEVSSSTDLSA